MTDCETNMATVHQYADGTSVFGREECLVTEHTFAQTSVCESNCFDAACMENCPQFACQTSCEAGCLDFFTSSNNFNDCNQGCMISCWEFKGSDHTCAGMSSCGYYGTDPLCLNDGSCQFEDSHNDCYASFQIGCRFINGNIQGTNTGTADPSPTETSPYSIYCQEKCTAIYGWMLPDMSANCLIGCNHFELANDITTPKTQEGLWKYNKHSLCCIVSRGHFLAISN